MSEWHDSVTDWREFFGRYGDYGVRIQYYEMRDGIDLELMYRMFKARMEAERSADRESDDAR